MNKVSVEMFCKQYKALSKGNDKPFRDFLKKHIVTDYVPFLQKDVVCTGIVNATCKVKEEDREFIKINSTGRYIMFVLKLIELYTDIEITFKDAKYVEQYDELNMIGAINTLISTIPESEYAEFSTLLNMKLDDFRDNEYSLTAMLYNFKQSLSLSEEVIKSVLEEIAKQENNKE